MHLLGTIATLASATTDAFGDALDGIAADNLIVIPLAVAAGLGMWATPVVIRFGKRIFSSSK